MLDLLIVIKIFLKSQKSSTTLILELYIIRIIYFKLKHVHEKHYHKLDMFTILK